MIPLRNRKLGRRTMLRGMLGGGAVAIGLPPLEAMLGRHGDAYADGSELPVRFMSIMFGCGVQLARWEPTTSGSDYALSEQLQPFAGVKDYLSVCTGLHNHFGGSPITHHEGMCVFSGHDFVLRPDLPGFASDWGGPTIDQLVADALEAGGAQTPVRSVQLGWTKFDSPADSGSTAKCISARGEPGSLTMLYPETNPQAVWQSLFGEFGMPLDTREVRLSILDIVRDDTARLRMQLGVKDKQRLDAHLQGVSELEAKISAMPPVCQLPRAPRFLNDEANGAEQLTEVNTLMAQLVAYAFTCDITRVASYHMLSVASEVQFGEIGQFSTQHGNSHAGDENYNQGIIFIMGRIADMMGTFAQTEDIDGGNLLDSMLLFASSEVSQGFTHSWQRQPILVGGHGRGYLTHPGIHYQAIAPSSPGDDQTSAGNTTDVLLTLLRAFDPEAPSVGAGAPMSTTPLDALLA
ncbi:MAG: DUF1552 domain-containing protein [Deltaproteobacteria bacterium]|nr:DUF1552 domain-containing protein [Deltaproteobacteria bacterium]MBP7289453.1 DUF1552 domain-containing protein [Nannocystaceae bacterium]